eukprot:2248630-Rhodomonas_salina.4
MKKRKVRSKTMFCHTCLQSFVDLRIDNERGVDVETDGKGQATPVCTTTFGQSPGLVQKEDSGAYQVMYA